MKIDRLDERRSELGSISLIFAASFTVLAGFAVATVVLGRRAYERRHIQNAADAAALAAAYMLELHGTGGMGLRAQDRRFACETAAASLPGDPIDMAHCLENIRVIRRWNDGPAAQPERRVVVRVGIRRSFDSGQRLIPSQETVTQTFESAAQVNEMQYGDTWPALMIALDDSNSMKQHMDDDPTLSATNMMANAIRTYAHYKLPARNGVLIFRDHTGTADAPVASPPPLLGGNNHNLDRIDDVLAKRRTPPGSFTNAAEALERSKKELDTADPGNVETKSAIYISDGEPTMGRPGRPPGDPEHRKAGKEAADKLRGFPEPGIPGQGINLFSVFIWRRNSTDESIKFMKDIGGKAGRPVDLEMYREIHRENQLLPFLIGLAKHLCAYGPVRPGIDAGAGLNDPVRLRPTTSNLKGVPGDDAHPRRIFALLREQTGEEMALPMVDNVLAVPKQHGFEYVERNEAGEKRSYVILTLASCAYLGDATRRLVVRWDHAQLSPLPYP